jgi:GNAT superfamily N-acetyltransferase
MQANRPFTIRRLDGASEAELQELAALLVDCVEGGASVSFMHPLTADRALAFWRDVARGVDRGDRALLVAGDAQGIVGTVQVVLAQAENQPHRADVAKMLVRRQNQPHRADVAKMLVRRRARRQGLGARLMQAAEDVARECGKTLLVLDTASDDAERLYERLGWRRVGVIPGYALLPQGGLCDTVYFYRTLGDA